MDPETRTVLASSGLAGFEQALNGLGVQRLEDLELLTSDDLSKIGMTVIQTRKYAQAVKTAQDRISQAEAAAQDNVDAHRSNSISNTDSVSRASSERDEKKKGIRHTFAAFPFRNKKKAAKGSPTFSDSASFESGERSSFGAAPRSFFSRDKKPAEAQRDDGGGYNDGGHEDGRESIMDPSLKLDVRVVRVSQWDYNQSLEASTNTIAVLHMYKGHTGWTRMETKSGPSKQNLKFGSLYYTSEVTRDVGNTTVKVPVVKAVAQVRASVAQVMGVLLLESSERMQERLSLLDGTYVNGQIMRIVAPRSKDGKSSSYTYPKLPLCTIKRSCHLLPDTKQLRDFVFRDSYEMRLEDGKQIGVRSMVSVELGECANRGSAQVVRGTIHEGSGIVVVPISEDHCEVCFVLAATTDTKSSSIFSTKTARALKHLEAMVSFTDSIRVWVEGRLRRFGSLQNAEDFPPEIDVSGGDSSPLLTGISSKAASRLFSDTEAPMFNLQEPSSPTSRLASFPSEEVEDDSTGDEAEAEVEVEKDLPNLDEMALCDAPPSLPAKPKVLPMMSSSISHNDSMAVTSSDTHDETAKAQEGLETMQETSTLSTQLETKPSPEKSVDTLRDSVPAVERAVEQTDEALQVLEADETQDTVPPAAPAANEMAADESETKEGGANVEEDLAAESTSAEEAGGEEPVTQGGTHALEDTKAGLADTCDDSVQENEAVSPGLLAALELSEPTTETSVAVEETVKAVEERTAIPSVEQDSTPLNRESVGEQSLTTTALTAESVEVNESDAIDVVKDVIENLMKEITGEAGETEGTTREETQNIQPTKELDGGELQLTLDIPNATTVIADIPVEPENNRSGATTPVTPVPSTKDEAMEKMKRELEDMRQKLKEKEENERQIRAELEERRRKSMAIRKGVKLDRLETDLDTIGEGENEDVTPPGREPSSRESNASRHSAGSQGSLGSAGGQSMESGSPGGGGVHLEDEIRRLRRLLEITRPFLPEDFNEEDAHLTLAEAETRMRKALEILMGENISPAEMMQAQAEFERYDRIVSNHPEFKQREADKWQRWEEANATKNADALKEMRELVKERYFSSTPTDLEKEGVSPLLIKRIAQKKVFQLYYKSTEEIEKLHQVALLGTYSAQGLDIVEMRALYSVVPKTFANDPEGKKTQWRENMKQKLSEMIRKEETNQLRGEEKRSRAYAKAPEPGKASKGGMPSIRTGGRGPPAGLAAALAKRGGGGPPGRGPPGRGPPAGLAAALAKRGGGDTPGRGPPAGLAEALAKRGGGPRPARGPPAGLAEALAKRAGGAGPAGAPRGPPAGLAEALAKRAGAPRGPPAGLAEALAKRTGGAGGAGGAPGLAGPARGPPAGLAEALAKRTGNGAATVAKPGQGPPAGLAEALAKRSAPTEAEQSNKSSSTEKAISPNVLKTTVGSAETPQPSVPPTKESAPRPSLEGKLEVDSTSRPASMESVAKSSPVSDLDLMQTLEAEFGSSSRNSPVVEASQASSVLSERPGSETSAAKEAELSKGETLHQADKEEQKHPKSEDEGTTAPPLPEKTVQAPTSSIEKVKATTPSSDLPVGSEILPPANAAPFISPVKTSPSSPLAQEEDVFQDALNGSTESPLASPSSALNTSLPDLVSTSESSQANMTTMQESASVTSATKEPLDLKPKGSVAEREVNHEKLEPQAKRKDSVSSSNSNDELSEILQNTFGLGKKVKLGVTPSAPSQALSSGGPSATNTSSDIPSMDSLEARLQQEWQDSLSATASERSELKKEKQGSVSSSGGTGLSSPTLPPKPESLQTSEKKESKDKKEKASKDDDWEADLMSSLSSSF